MPVPFQLQRLALKYAELSQDMDFETRNQGDSRKTRQEHQTRLHRSLPTAEQDAERPAWHRSVPPRGRGRERCGLHWNESSARAGAFLGGAIQAVAVAGYLCVGYCAGLVGSLGEAVNGFGSAYIPGWEYIKMAWAFKTYPLMVYDVMVGDGLSLGYSTLGLVFRNIEILQVPFFVWRGVAAGFHDIDQRYRDML